MEEVTATPPRRPTVVLDTCPSCRGLWLDAPDIVHVALTLFDLPRFEVASLGRQGAGIAACPRCRAKPYEFPVLGVPIDQCLRCGGIWLDGDEYKGLSEAADELDGLPPARGQGGAYRVTAIKAARDGVVYCAVCARATALPDTLAWEEGLICEPCWQSRADRRVEKEPPPPPKGWVEALLRDLSALLDLARRCSICGRRGPSRCGHEAEEATGARIELTGIEK